MQRVCKDAGTPLKRREKHWEATLVCSQVEKGKAGPKGCSDKCVGLGHAALICRVCGEAVLICKRKQGRNAEGGEARQMQRSSVAAPCWRRPMASHQGSSRARLRARCCSSCSSSAPQTCVNVNGAIRIWWEQFHGISRPIAIATRRYTKQTNPPAARLWQTAGRLASDRTLGRAAPPPHGASTAMHHGMHHSS